MSFRFTLEQLQAFVDVYESGSFIRAGQRSGKHATTFSKRISNLEVDLGIDLFERGAASLKPSEHAKILYQYAQNVLMEAEQLANKARDCMAGQPSEITIALDSSIIPMGVIEAIEGQMAKLPSIDLKLLTGDTTNTLERVLSGEADTGISLSVPLYDRNIHVSQLFHFTAINVTSKAYGHKFGLKNGDVIEQSQRAMMEQLTLDFLVRLGLEKIQAASNHRMVVSDFQTTLAWIKQGRGWSQLPGFMCREWIDKGELLSFQVNQEGQNSWPVDAYWLATKAQPQALTVLITALQDLPDLV